MENFAKKRFLSQSIDGVKKEFEEDEAKALVEASETDPKDVCWNQSVIICQSGIIPCHTLKK